MFKYRIIGRSMKNNFNIFIAIDDSITLDLIKDYLSDYCESINLTNVNELLVTEDNQRARKFYEALFKLIHYFACVLSFLRPKKTV